MSQDGPAMDDRTGFGCQNTDCPDYGQRGHGNLTVSMRYGSGATGVGGGADGSYLDSEGVVVPSGRATGVRHHLGPRQRCATAADSHHTHYRLRSRRSRPQ
jgi:hypothetical protein